MAEGTVKAGVAAIGAGGVALIRTTVDAADRATAGGAVGARAGEVSQGVDGPPAEGSDEAGHPQESESREAADHDPGPEADGLPDPESTDVEATADAEPDPPSDAEAGPSSAKDDARVPSEPDGVAPPSGSGESGDEHIGQPATSTGTRDEGARYPVGYRGNQNDTSIRDSTATDSTSNRYGREINVSIPEGYTARNAPADIGGREYSGHALDRMQGRGFVPSVVEHTIETGESSPGRHEGTSVHYNPVDRFSVITNTENGRVITVMGGDRR
ncbi:DUF4258 domain-containing protein [Streptomyces sp. NPDC015501]|uniref:DUF4258 domain-containing protein n=1 Tax=unclassified Streptomyces TaxID=2593676 RepID=UPI0011A51446|nr:DUF4258 domain-containing protein [Streptomyces sp. NBC_01178]